MLTSPAPLKTVEKEEVPVCNLFASTDRNFQQAVKRFLCPVDERVCGRPACVFAFLALTHVRPIKILGGQYPGSKSSYSLYGEAHTPEVLCVADEH